MASRGGGHLVRIWLHAETGPKGLLTLAGMCETAVGFGLAEVDSDEVEVLGAPFPATRG